MPIMIEALDHVVLLCPDIDEAVADYSVLMGAEPVRRAGSEGIATALFAVQNTAIELMAPAGEGKAADKLRAMIAGGAKLTSLAYRTDDIEEAHRILVRRAGSPSGISVGSSQNADGSAARSWKRFRIPDTVMAGIKSFVLERTSSAKKERTEIGSGAVLSMDPLVINTPNPERAIVNYGARMGLNFALDRTAEQWKTRFVFFRLGALTLEVIHRLGVQHDPSGPDALWGITWQVADLDAAHTRLGAAGRDISEIRDGRKPGSRVFTVRDGTQGVATLFIAHAPR